MANVNVLPDWDALAFLSAIPRLPGNPKNLLPTGGEAILLCS